MLLSDSCLCKWTHTNIFYFQTHTHALMDGFWSHYCSSNWIWALLDRSSHLLCPASPPPDKSEEGSDGAMTARLAWSDTADGTEGRRDGEGREPELSFLIRVLIWQTLAQRQCRFQWLERNSRTAVSAWPHAPTVTHTRSLIDEALYNLLFTVLRNKGWTHTDLHTHTHTHVNIQTLANHFFCQSLFGSVAEMILVPLYKERGRHGVEKLWASLSSGAHILMFSFVNVLNFSLDTMKEFIPLMSSDLHFWTFSLSLICVFLSHI